MAEALIVTEEIYEVRESDIFLRTFDTDFTCGLSDVILISLKNLANRIQNSSTSGVFIIME